MHGTRTTQDRRAFTLVELLMSVLIIGILMGLLIVGFRVSKKFVTSVTDRTAIANIRIAASKFSSEFGFPPPLVKDRATATPASVVANGANRSKMAVYNFLRVTGNADLTELLPVAPASQSSPNPFFDPRYSERTIAYYLVGACNTERNRGEADPQAKKVPIDGVFGPGFYTPNVDGTFIVPQDVKSPDHDGQRDAARQTRRAQKVFESFIDLSGKGVSLRIEQPSTAEGTTAADPNGFRSVAIVDAKGIPVRFYRWINPDTVTGIQDLRIPPLVARDPAAFTKFPPQPDRDLAANPAIRSAKFAIVAAGPDGAFGDEDPDLLGQRMGRSLTGAPADEIQRVRIEAERDNIVEVGQ